MSPKILKGPLVIWSGVTKDDSDAYPKSVSARVVIVEADYNREGIAWHLVFEVEDGKDALGVPRWKKWPNEAFPTFLSRAAELFLKEKGDSE